MVLARLILKDYTDHAIQKSIPILAKNQMVKIIICRNLVKISSLIYQQKNFKVSHNKRSITVILIVYLKLLMKNQKLLFLDVMKKKEKKEKKESGNMEKKEKMKMDWKKKSTFENSVKMVK